MEVKTLFNSNLGINLDIFVKDDEVLFLGKEVAEGFGYKDTVKAIRMHVDDEDKILWCDVFQRGETETETPRREGETPSLHLKYKPNRFLIKESGFYTLAFGSKMPKAKQFKRWVTSEVLPSIRKTGTYTDTFCEKLNKILPESYLYKLQDEKPCTCGTVSFSCLCNNERTNTRKLLVKKADILKSKKCVENGKLGAVKFWDNYYKMKAEVEKQKEELLILKEEIKNYQKITLDEIINMHHGS